MQKGDVFQYDTVLAAVRGADAVVFCAGVASVAEAGKETTIYRSAGAGCQARPLRATMDELGTRVHWCCTTVAVVGSLTCDRRRSTPPPAASAAATCCAP